MTPAHLQLHSVFGMGDALGGYGTLVSSTNTDVGGACQATFPTLETGASIGIEPQTALAHQLSGWNAMQQQFGLRGNGQTVAVIDSGIAWDHLALGKGYGAGYRVVGGWDFAENDSNPYDDGPTGFHGTHVAGIVGSDSAKSIGVAPGVDLVALRVFTDSGHGKIEWVEQALSWVHANRTAFASPITTVNLSLGTAWNENTVPNWGTLEEELRQLYEDGIVVIASAGNSFKQYNAPGLSYPAASPYVLPVSSVDDSGSLSDFSQRSDRVLAAPGRSILSTVPDHVLGRDGKVDDFSTASGTSMAAPYVAGAAVLVREAMEMVGASDASSAKIISWLHDTADTVFDSLTNARYDRLNLQTAIDTLLPDDDIGNTISSAQSINLSQGSLSGWINHIGDTDVYRFTTAAAGQLTLDADSQWVKTLHWDLTSNGQTLTSGNLDPQSLHLAANQTYEFRLSAAQEIGPFSIGMQYQPDALPTPTPISPTVSDLGRIDYFSKDVVAGSTYRATALHDGIFTVQWDNPDSGTGALTVRGASGTAVKDTSWEGGMLRIDVDATAGQVFSIDLPGLTSDTGKLTLVDTLQHRGSELQIRDTSSSDSIKLDLSRGVGVDYGAVHYEFAANQLTRVVIDGAINNDQLAIVGSPQAEKVELKPGLFTLENAQLNVVASGMENVHFDGGIGVSDRVYLYDSDGDDTLNARPGSAELTGVGYRFSVEHVERIFVHATGLGEDLAYLVDSSGDDQLSVRPQFTSLWGNGYFNSVRGFERVYVYATAGGYDTADLYDSSGDDRFSAGGEAASIVGAGFFSYTRFFEQVQAHATAGGHDLATLYGADGQTQWQRGSDFISYRESTWDRNAQGFERVQSYVAGLGQSQLSIASLPADFLPSTLALTGDHADTVASPLPEKAPSSIQPFRPATGQVTFSSATSAENSGQVVSQVSSQVVDQFPSHRADQFSSQVFDHLSSPMSKQHAVSPTWDTVASQGWNDSSSLRSTDGGATDTEHELAANVLLEALALHDELTNGPLADDLRWHTDPASERALLDKIFQRWG